MKITLIGGPRVIMSNPLSRHNYFGWPSAARLKNGRIAVAASGFRERHICPFGKAVVSFSEDEGESYSPPAPVIDTVLDDRDAGIVPFGESGVILTSFNNTVEFQRQCIGQRIAANGTQPDSAAAYDAAYLDTVSPEAQAAVLGSTFRISRDNGVTFGELHISPVTSPHGPLELQDGTLLWVGTMFALKDENRGGNTVKAYRIYPADGRTEYVGEIENVTVDGELPLSCEPHAVLLPDGRIVAHIRVQTDGERKLFTVFQSVSDDLGRTWSVPRQLLPQLGGSPPHLLLHSSGMLLSAYGFREKPYGIKVMFSRDGGEIWDVGHDIYVTDASPDLGYPATVELRDGSLLTVFYARTSTDGPAVIMQQKWSFEP